MCLPQSLFKVVSFFLFSCFETGSRSLPFWLHWLVSERQEFSCLPLSTLDYRWITVPGIIVDAGALIAGPHACLAGVLLTVVLAPPIALL